MDARDLNDFMKFDEILLDVPCSGSGTITNKDDELHIKVFDGKDNNIGTISYMNDNSGIKFNADINDDTNKYLASYQIKKENKWD